MGWADRKICPCSPPGYVMRAVFSVVGLLLVVVVISLLAKKQIAQISPLAATPQGPASAQQLPQQVKQAVDAALQTPRSLPDEKP